MILWALAAVAQEPQVRPVTDPTAPVRAAVVLALNGQAPGTAGAITAAEAEATALADALWSAGFDWVLTRTGAAVTVDGVSDALGRLAALDLGPDDTALVYLASHGATCPALGDRWTQHLATADTDLTDDKRCWSGAITDADLLAQLRATGAGQRVLVLEACLTRLGSYGAAPTSGADPLARDRLDELVLRSTRYGLSAYELGDVLLYTRGFRTGLTDLAADLDGDGAVTAVEAHEHAIAAVGAADVAQVPMRQQVVIGAARDVVLAGTPGERTRPVVVNLPTRGRYGIGPTPVALGSSNLPVVARGPLTARDGLGVSLRVLGVPTDPVLVPARPWIAGRRRGWPSVVGGGAVSGWTGLDDLPFRTPGPLTGWARLHLPLLPHLVVAAEAEGGALRGEAVALTGEVHVRRWTVAVGPRAGWYRLEPAGPAAERALGTRLGGELDLRVGLAGPVGGVLAGVVDWSAAATEERQFPVRSAGVRLGLLIDLGLLGS